MDSGLLSAAGFDGLLLEPVDGFSTLDGLEEVLELGDGSLVSGTVSFASIFPAALVWEEAFSSSSWAAFSSWLSTGEGEERAGESSGTRVMEDLGEHPARSNRPDRAIRTRLRIVFII